MYDVVCCLPSGSCQQGDQGLDAMHMWVILLINVLIIGFCGMVFSPSGPGSSAKTHQREEALLRLMLSCVGGRRHAIIEQFRAGSNGLGRCLASDERDQIGSRCYGCIFGVSRPTECFVVKCTLPKYLSFQPCAHLTGYVGQNVSPSTEEAE